MLCRPNAPPASWTTRAPGFHPSPSQAEITPLGCGGAGYPGAGGADLTQTSQLLPRNQDHRTADGRGRLTGFPPPLQIYFEGRAGAG
ncbi:hypothetical protein KCP70_09810 [Salmonella enterica subsp. enterica]|nr:hypothetical protein KCP70_09810 [Salmonella enterica subsp. enterica]